MLQSFADFSLLHFYFLFFVVDLFPPSFPTSLPAPAEVGEDRGFMSRYGLDDWKLALPVGILVSMPTLANEVSA